MVNRQKGVCLLHRKGALTTSSQRLTFAPSTIERVGSNKIGRPEVDWVISLVWQRTGPPNLKKPTTLRGVVGVWNRESGDYIRGRVGACFHAVRFLARSERLEHNQYHGLFRFPNFFLAEILPTLSVSRHPP